MKLWDSRFKKKLDKEVEKFTFSLSVDKQLARYDISGSIAHIKMLAKTKIIKEKEAGRIIKNLEEIKEEIGEEKFIFKNDEDIHTAIERSLTERIGTLAEKLHTGRSRNDQIALDERLYTKEKIKEVVSQITEFQKVILALAKRHQKVIMPGYTHLQHSQPVLFAHHLLAYLEMLERDKNRLKDSYARVNVSPLGAGAGVGTSLPIDRKFTAKILGFEKIAENSIDAVGDRDFLLEVGSAGSILMMHLSRLSEEIILWATEEFGFLEIDDSFATGSSLMPNKKNPDVPELIRGKTARIYGELFGLFSLMKNLPLSYNRDMQEDKKGFFEIMEIVGSALAIYTKFLPKVSLNQERMKEMAERGGTTATDLVEYLVEKDIPFREAHRIVGKIIRDLKDSKRILKNLTLTELKKFSDEFKKDALERVKAESSVKNKTSFGGTSPKQVNQRIKNWEKRLK
ncbi:MAG: argininosuccinate lyase [bacterium (Candidatus Ratteibacteria) CG_4_10_14_3_um_filter_41_18]|uniref:Argininosuccinate lyase n=4 Tax=Candidatus Ratteibacteria TaxID=2979319 RepID=A0A2M7E712_9BACT|nr:MAG: argininosuccinate lyase [Candidatus Omnitrophica bacterium CG1_02_41_171]PIV63519.1 MAG: argininosuccinate lyase [bacterium (Candidatus Ratteibacteria) CG01_land_8_20_14_3_00_40_19]PIW34295.1 MAG: argininosuccinate lyase [bacterium (Candidatus Ratteibacteria) CG15_BIG_FIL_POST_REV_8_21_14_020_41_12]PIW74170.1 MAG: argininosuccinate lyase [bacterium (Candidatus Ratteibacteria) CG_4_8_14_3_um_filter_41_36]PIX76827.1 MAG: argininosuccinate lyase [bacterium (Candidatus Ratteibacteria) CG_4_